MNLAKILKKENIFITKSCKDLDDFYSEYAKFLETRGIVNDWKTIKRLFVKRENIQSTGINQGAAAPHIFSDEFSEFLFSVALIKEGLDFKAPDEADVFLVFLIMSDERDVGLHLKSLAHIARLVKSTDVVETAKKAETTDAVYDVFVEKEMLV
ncbi:MAG: PTS sugar transporter subunit IIA [Candidatus Aminicenantes bacterium]|jgi:mannitol/fructose-specific phosphotransferase system IIA component (Ntr-type)|nr:PTS sugar transporter subunit IIA [Candidatus Aminicenantes bacterium]